MQPRTYSFSKRHSRTAPTTATSGDGRDGYWEAKTRKSLTVKSANHMRASARSSGEYRTGSTTDTGARSCYFFFVGRCSVSVV